MLMLTVFQSESIYNASLHALYVVDREGVLADFGAGLLGWAHVQR